MESLLRERVGGVETGVQREIIIIIEGRVMMKTAVEKPAGVVGVGGGGSTKP